ncbi:MAG: His-Xaa-Ser system radical SAM maturase HxsB [Elusimicrobia bacterium]|nr:His-Xaa-Ser system radical SAM maturase HxsB [Elusimicrobiota bacterium]
MKNKTGIPPHFYWARLGNEYLLTNDAGEFACLDAARFRRFAGSGALGVKTSKYRELRDKNFIRDRLDFDGFSAKWGSSNAYLHRGPGLHIMVLTLRCDHKCVYCQSGAIGASSKKTDMDLATARKCVEFALKSPNSGITIEFQGGEPLLNWPALKETVSYGTRRAKEAGKELKFALVSNFSLMTLERADFLIKNCVALCTSLDGPAALHDKIRILAGGSSHAAAVKWLSYFGKKCGRDSDCGPSALLTVSKHSFGRAGEIVDEYAGLGLASIFIRPLTPIGCAGALWDKIGYSAEDFAGFYRESLAHIIDLNKKGTFLKEKTAFLILKKALGFKDNKYVDLRDPCGAGLGQLAYNYNGDLYTCDEARMLAWEGDGLFKTGNVFKDAYRKVVSSAPVKACASASGLDWQPACARCVWRPYCGVCPVYNYRTQGSLWGHMPANQRCRLLKGIFEAVFTHLRDKKTRSQVFEKWLNS